MNKVKYMIQVTGFDCKMTEHYATEIHFHPGTGGIDIHDTIHETPIFPIKEEEVKRIVIIPVIQ